MIASKDFDLTPDSWISNAAWAFRSPSIRPATRHKRHCATPREGNVARKRRPHETLRGRSRIDFPISSSREPLLVKNLARHDLAPRLPGGEEAAAERIEETQLRAIGQARRNRLRQLPELDEPQRGAGRSHCVVHHVVTLHTTQVCVDAHAHRWSPRPPRAPACAVAGCRRPARASAVFPPTAGFCRSPA